jgi:hypothetical protein
VSDGSGVQHRNSKMQEKLFLWFCIMTDTSSCIHSGMWQSGRVDLLFSAASVMAQHGQLLLLILEAPSCRLTGQNPGRAKKRAAGGAQEKEGLLDSESEVSSEDELGNPSMLQASRAPQ